MSGVSTQNPPEVPCRRSERCPHLLKPDVIGYLCRCHKSLLPTELQDLYGAVHPPEFEYVNGGHALCADSYHRASAIHESNGSKHPLSPQDRVSDEYLIHLERALPIHLHTSEQPALAQLP